MAKTSSAGTIRSMADGGRRSSRGRRLNAMEAGLLDRENEIAILEGRNGEPVASHSGKKAEVEVPVSDLGRATGGRLVHNHPEASNYPLTMLTFSPADLRVAMQQNLREMVAVTKHRGKVYRHVLRRTGKSWPPGMGKAISSYSKKVKRKGADPHRWLQQMAQRLGFSYERSETDG